MFDARGIAKMESYLLERGFDETYVYEIVRDVLSHAVAVGDITYEEGTALLKEYTA